MTPAQISIVENTMAIIDMNELASDFYARAFAAEPTLTTLFTTDPHRQRGRFAAELVEILRHIRTVETFATRTRSLGERHHGYGVQPPHYALMGAALLDALAGALGEGWNDQVAEAWAL